jgi:2-keto-3-deoxy-L-rhamnonate aldolase RhmA
MKCRDGSLKQKIASGNYVFAGCVMDSRTGAVIEAYEEAGYDYVMIDREHTTFDFADVAELIRVSRIVGIPCMVRVAEPSYTELCRTLDQWPDGVWVPRIRTRADVEAVVEKIKYPPLGKRGLGASTCPAGKYIGWDTSAEMVETLNRDTVLGIQIETKEALDNLDDILSVPGIDVALVGNDDLSVGLGITGQFESETYVNAIKQIVAACNRHGVQPGIAGGDPAWVKRWSDLGMRHFWAACDIGFIWTGAAQAIKSVREVVGQ